MMGLISLYRGLKGVGIVLKMADEEKPEEEKNKKIQQKKRFYTIVGTISIIVGIIAILFATVWHI
jgi:uncharacterized protein YqhQ